MTQSISWQLITSSSATKFGTLERLKVKGGWLVSDQSSATAAANTLMEFIPDPAGKWVTPELVWETLTTVSGSVSFGNTVRTRVADGWLVGHIIGTTVSSRTLNYIPDAFGDWLTDPPILQTIGAVPDFSWIVGQTVSFVPTVTNPSNLVLGFSLTGVLPTGLVFNTINGSITGTITAAATLTGLAVSVSSVAGVATSNKFSITIPVPLVMPIIGIPSTLSIDTGQPVTIIPTLTNPSNLTLSFSASGLPSGLSINSITGIITGATLPLTASIYVTAVCSLGSVTSNTLLLTVNALPVPTPTTSRWIGTNLMPVSDWGTDFPFLNYILRSRKWLSGTWLTWNDNRALNLDLQGNILSLIGTNDQQAKMVIFTAARRSGNFVLTWTGTGTFSWIGATVVSQGKNTMTVTPASSGNTILLLTSTDPINPVRGLSFVHESQATLIGLFNPDFLADMAKYSCIRFMDWQKTNFSRTAAEMAADFTPLASLPVYVTDNGVPLELMIELCNQANINGWFCIPVQADATYIDQFLTTISAKLKTGLKAYIESSNEVWNGIFPQATLIGGTTFDERMKNHALRTADISDKVRTILGSRGVSVIGSWAGQTYWQEQILLILKNAGRVLPDVLATAPYFGNGLPDDPLIFTDGRLDKEVTTQINGVIATKAITDKYNIKLVCYEGGSTVMPGALVNRDPRMGDTYLKYLRGIKAANPGGLFNHYAYISYYGSSGAWGEKEMLYNQATGKSAAIATVISES